MKILFVIDQFTMANNGTTISSRRFAEFLKKRGHNVRIVTTNAKSSGYYCVPERKIPIVTKIAHKQGMVFAKPVKSVLIDAIKWCDIAHLIMPFLLCKNAVKIAKKYNKPVTSAYHVQAENITYNIHLDKSETASKLVYKYFYYSFYKNIKYIHCPSLFIKKELRKNGFNQHLIVISNGVDNKFNYNRKGKTEELKDKFIIMMVGRLSKEKRQDVLINAVKLLDFQDKIQLIFAGKGPLQGYYEEISKGLINHPKFVFLKQDELIDYLSYSDLYVHSADIEIEAISCLEALTCGIVPLIANSCKSATPQFALDERSLFIAGDSTNLAKKIEYWYNNKEELEVMGKEYSNSAKKYNIEKSIDKLEEMFNFAIEDNAKFIEDNKEND